MISSRTVGNAVILDLGNTVEPDQLKTAVEHALSANQLLLLNLSSINFIESSGLGALVNIHKLAEERGKTVHYFGMHSYVRKLVELTKLDRILKIHETEEAALAVAK
jgi:anti-sigma B factor antagonist